MEFPARQALVVIKIPARHENFHLKRLSLLDPSSLIVAQRCQAVFLLKSL
jgi:hypothetical protein